MPISAGSILKGNIEIERELGQGAMGVVWRARNVALDCPVAVKVLAARVADEPDARARFAQEARAIAKVDSQHVVRIFDYGVTEDDQPFFVMELLRGEDLRVHMESRGPLGVEATVAIVRQLCSALERAHELGIVHRDLKPANVMVLEQPGELFVKVLDFGVAKLAGPEALDLTSSSALVGTPYYMSPEQLIEPSRVDRRADLWSVAVIAYACLTGKLPFAGETIGALSVAVHRGVFAPPSAARSALPVTLDAWFERAFATEPARRFGSAGSLARSLEEAALGRAPSEPDAASRAGSKPSLDAETLDAPLPARAAPLQAARVEPLADEGTGALQAVGDESMGGVGASIGASGPVRVPAALLVASVLVAGGVALYLSSSHVVTTHDGSVSPSAGDVSVASVGATAPAASAPAASAPPLLASDTPGSSSARSAERVEPSPATSTSAARRPLRSGALATSGPVATPAASGPPPSPPPPRTDIDGIPIVE